MKYEQDWDLTTIPIDALFHALPDATMKRLWALRRASFRQPYAVHRECPYCHEMIVGTRKWREHKPLCPQNPKTLKGI
jgi:hypothetical protein